MGSEDLIIQNVQNTLDTQARLLSNSASIDNGQTEDRINSFKTTWYDEGKAAGRYLLRQIQNDQLQDKIKAWEYHQPSPPVLVSPAYKIWPQKIRFQTNRSFDIDSHIHPFGPLKAEDDPRLPLFDGQGKSLAMGMFYSGHPLWNKSISESE